MNYEPDKGMSIYRVSEVAVKMAKDNGTDVTFKFNDIEIRASQFSHPDDLATIYLLKSKIRRMEEGKE